MLTLLSTLRIYHSELCGVVPVATSFDWDQESQDDQQAWEREYDEPTE